MKKIIFLLIIVAMVASCKTAKNPSTAKHDNANIEAGSKGYDGSSYNNAVIISAANESAGVPMEYKWLKEHYPGYKMQRQSLMNDKGKHYDVIDIITSDGHEKSIYFDISNFFGKF